MSSANVVLPIDPRIPRFGPAARYCNSVSIRVQVFQFEWFEGFEARWRRRHESFYPLSSSFERSQHSSRSSAEQCNKRDLCIYRRRRSPIGISCHFCRGADRAKLVRHDDGAISVFREYSANCRSLRRSSVLEPLKLLRKNMPHRPSDPGIINLERAARRYWPVNIYPLKPSTSKFTSPDDCAASSSNPAAVFPSVFRICGTVRAAPPCNDGRHDLHVHPSCDNPYDPDRTLALSPLAVSASLPL